MVLLWSLEPRLTCLADLTNHWAAFTYYTDQTIKTWWKIEEELDILPWLPSERSALDINWTIIIMYIFRRCILKISGTYLVRSVGYVALLCTLGYRISRSTWRYFVFINFLASPVWIFTPQPTKTTCPTKCRESK